MSQYNPNDAVIIDAIRTPMGRSKQGIFKHTRADDLSAHLIKTMMARQPLWSPESTNDVIWGCVKQTAEQDLNIARNALLLAGMPHSVPGQTVNRLCGSSMQAIHNATMAIQAGYGQTYLVGGVEHMGHIPMDFNVDINPAASIYSAKAANLMGVTAEMLGRFNDVSREDQDTFALRSHVNAAKATKQGYWKTEIIPTEGHDANGFKTLYDTDEVIRFDATLEALSGLKPVFDPKSGTVTAGSSSALSDGASAILITSFQQAKAMGLSPRAKIKALGIAGCDPSLMGRGPVPATHQALKNANVSLQDIQTIELNEAFAAQSIAVLKELELMDVMDDKVNLQGGAIALGHPLGCSGSRIVGTLLNIMERKDTQLGLATMCIGLGQGIATVIERM